jgi:hypothetical protein
VIQDVKTQKMIGLGNLCDGLYKFHSSPHNSSLEAHCVSSVVNPCNKIPLDSYNSVSHANVSMFPHLQSGTLVWGICPIKGFQ